MYFRKSVFTHSISVHIVFTPHSCSCQEPALQEWHLLEEEKYYSEEQSFAYLSRGDIAWCPVLATDTTDVWFSSRLVEVTHSLMVTWLGKVLTEGVIHFQLEWMSSAHQYIILLQEILLKCHNHFDCKNEWDTIISLVIVIHQTLITHKAFIQFQP